DISVGSQQGIHDIVVAATEGDSVYAIDAHTGAVLWHDNFTDPAAGITTIPSQALSTKDLIPQVGITSTPVIDPQTDLLYVVARTQEMRSDGAHYVYRLHALDLGSGAEALGGPVVIADTLVSTSGDVTYVNGPSVPGQGTGSVEGVVHFNA